MPYPEPTSFEASRIGKANRRTGTAPEVRIRSGLHRRGFRFRKDRLIRVADVRVRPDVVFPTERLAAFIDGCFWHCCPEHCHNPRSNVDYWVPKLDANVARDRRVDAALDAAGWVGVRVWEHVAFDEAVDVIAAAVVNRRLAQGSMSLVVRIVPDHEHPDAAT